MSWCVVRRQHGPLHIASPTGRGYTTLCGHTLAGSDLDVPRPKWPTTKQGLSRYWGKVWALEVQCRKCRRAVASPAVGVHA